MPLVDKIIKFELIDVDVKTAVILVHVPVVLNVCVVLLDGSRNVTVVAVVFVLIHILTAYVPIAPKTDKRRKLFAPPLFVVTDAPVTVNPLAVPSGEVTPEVIVVAPFA